MSDSTRSLKKWVPSDTSGGCTPKPKNESRKTSQRAAGPSPRAAALREAKSSAPALTAPAAGLETSSTVIAFSWSASTDSVSAITGYRLQIAKMFVALLLLAATGILIFATLSWLIQEYQKVYTHIRTDLRSALEEEHIPDTLKIQTQIPNLSVVVTHDGLAVSPFDGEKTQIRDGYKITILPLYVGG